MPCPEIESGSQPWKGWMITTTLTRLIIYTYIYIIFIFFFINIINNIIIDGRVLTAINFSTFVVALF